MNTSIKKTVTILTIALTAVATTLFAIWACQTTARYHVYLHSNYFEYAAYTDDNSYAEMPIEIMLTAFRADTTTTDGTFLAETYIQQRGNKTPEGITTLTFAPYQVHTYQRYRIYIESYDYKQATGQLIVTMIVEQRRYQTW